MYKYIYIKGYLNIFKDNKTTDDEKNKRNDYLLNDNIIYISKTFGDHFCFFLILVSRICFLCFNSGSKTYHRISCIGIQSYITINCMCMCFFFFKYENFSFHLNLF